MKPSLWCTLLAHAVLQCNLHIIHHHFTFSDCFASIAFLTCDMQHPHALCCVQYSLWLDQHSMAEALDQIRGALDACAEAARGKAGFDEVFPLMRSLATGTESR